MRVRIVVAVEDKKGVTEHRYRTAQGKPTSHEHLAVEAIAHIEAEPASIADELAHLLAEISNTHHYPRNAMPPQQPQLMGNKRLAGDRRQSLGMAEVMGRRRVASPPARIATGKMSGVIVSADNFGPFEVEMEANLWQFRHVHGMA